MSGSRRAGGGLGRIFTTIRRVGRRLLAARRIFACRRLNGGVSNHRGLGGRILTTGRVGRRVSGRVLLTRRSGRRLLTTRWVVVVSLGEALDAVITTVGGGGRGRDGSGDAESGDGSSELHIGGF